MFGDMMGKLQEMQQQSEKVKSRLETISVSGEAEGGKVKVVCNGNRKVTSVELSEELMQENDKEQIEELTLLATNRALESAEKVYEAEMKDVAKGMLPGM